jgi:hypothetical protein
MNRLLLAAVLLIAAPAAAENNCNPPGGGAFETADLLKSLLYGDSPAPVSAELARTRAVTCETVGGMTVCNMKYDDKKFQFDCDDFAWCFDQEAKARGIESWQANIGARGRWFWDDDWNAHGINIIKVEMEGDPEGQTRWALIEPQQKDKKIAAVATWLQPEGQDPAVPKSVYPDIERYYPWFKKAHQAVFVFEDGHSPVAGEAPFTRFPDKVEQYKELTGNDPSGYDEEATEGTWMPQ